MEPRNLLLTSFVGILALGSAVALAQSQPQDAGSEPVVAPPPQMTEQAPDAVATNPPVVISDDSQSPVEDAPVETPAAGQSDWAPDINLDTLPQSTETSNGYVRRAKPRKTLSDASENVLGTGSWGQGRTSASAQAELLARAQRRERSIDPRKRSDLTKLSRVMGALHALRVSCAGREDQTYRSRMATMLDLEAPGNGDLRDPLVDSFNGGFQAYGRGASVCPTDQRAQEAGLAKDGFALAKNMSARYRPPPKVADSLPPATQPRQNLASKTTEVARAAAKAPPVSVPTPAATRPSWDTTGR